jgi:hypothetical protein
MRILAQIPHPKLRISIMAWNEKYIIEMEAGQYKQTFKIGQESVSGIEEVKALCTDELISNTIDRFNTMHKDFSSSFNALKNNIKS